MNKRYLFLWMISILKPLEYPLLPLRLIVKLNECLNKEIILFEYGCGYSTLWFNKLCKCYSVEHNPIWYKKLKNKGIKNLKLHTKKKNYINSIDDVKSKIDIVFVDGVYRNECLKKAESRIENGILILDDANRFEYNTWWLDKKYESAVFGGLKMNSTFNSKGYFEINNTKVWHITKNEKKNQHISYNSIFL